MHIDIFENITAIPTTNIVLYDILELFFFFACAMSQTVHAYYITIIKCLLTNLLAYKHTRQVELRNTKKKRN